MLNLSPFIGAAHDRVAAAMITPGVYRRYVGGVAEADPYGCADAANILYTIGAFPRDRSLREAFVAGINGLQSDDGLWHETTHHPIHTTAHCIAALELFDAPPARPPQAIAYLADPAEMERFLEGLEWSGNPWRASHQGAGLHTALTLSGLADREWRQRYGDWLAGHCDETGFWRRGSVGRVESHGSTTLFPHLAGSFHYLFALEYEHMPHPAPDRLIDSSLALEEENEFPLGRAIGFAEIDWVYCLTRAGRQTAHRFDDRMQALRRFAGRYTDYLYSLSDDDAGLGDLHMLFGVLCALAELQSALPGEIRTETPLKLVLDRRPFI